MKQMPRRVKVRAHEYRVLRPKRLKHGKTDCNGLCDTEGLDISVKAGLRRSHAQTYLLHELMHTLTTNTKVKLEHEEELVVMLSEGLLEVMQDNPKLVEYLMHK